MNTQRALLDLQTLPSPPLLHPFSLPLLTSLSPPNVATALPPSPFHLTPCWSPQLSPPMLRRHPAVDKACMHVSVLNQTHGFSLLSPPLRNYYILSNKPERTNISSLQKLPLALKPYFHLPLTYDSQQI